MSAITIQADECYDLVIPDMRSRFSISSAGSDSQAESEEQEASDDQEAVVATGHNTPQLAISANYGNDPPQPTVSASLLRHPSRRRGLVFPPPSPITMESARDFVEDDDTVSETSSEDFDTTLRPQDAVSSQEMSTVNHGTSLLVRESLDTIRPGTSLTPALKSGEDVPNVAGASSATFTWPIIGQDVISSDRSRPIVKKAMSASPVVSRTYSTSESPSPVPPSLGHVTRRKPVPKLEDYDRLFPTRPQPRTVTTRLPHTFLQSIPIERRPITPSSETDRDTMRSKSRLQRLHTAHLRESSPLRKILLPFSRGSHQTSPMQNNRISQIQSTADRPPPKLGSPIILSPPAVPSGRIRTSSSSQSTLVTSLDLSYDTRYLSPPSINSKDMRLNPTSSVPILPMPSTPDTTPDASSQSEYLHTPRSIGPATPSSFGSVPTTPACRRILDPGPTISSSELSSRSSSRCSTPAHMAFPALSLRSIANKVMTLPSTMMKRSSSSKTVTQVAYTQTQVRAVSPGFSRTTSPSPYVLGSPWMGSSDPDDVVSPDSCFYGASPNEMYRFGPVPSSHSSSRNVSPLPPAYQSSSFNYITSESSKTNLDPSHVDSASPSPRFPPFMSPHMRHLSVVDTTPDKSEGHFRGRSKPNTPENWVFTGIDRPLQVRSRSEGASVRPPEESNSKEVLKHERSFRSILGLVKWPSAKEEAGSSGSNEYDQQAHTRHRTGFLEPAIRGSNGSNGMLGPPDHKAWAADEGSSLGKGLGLSHSDSGWHQERLKMEITMTRRLVELLDAEHTQDYRRVQAMIDDVRADMVQVPRRSRGSSDGESIIDSYMQPNSHGGSVEMKEDAYDSDHSLKSHSRTLRAGDIVTSISSFDPKPGERRGGEIGYWYGMGEPADDIKS